MATPRIYLKGKVTKETYQNFIQTAFRITKNIMFVKELKDADLEVDITELNGSLDLRQHVRGVIEKAIAASNLQKQSRKAVKHLQRNAKNLRDRNTN